MWPLVVRTDFQIRQRPLLLPLPHPPKNNPKKGLGVTGVTLNDLWQERNAASTAAFLHLYTIGQMVVVKQSRFLCGQYYRAGKVLLESQDDTREDLLLIPYSQPF